LPPKCIICGEEQGGTFEDGFDPKLCSDCYVALDQKKLRPEQLRLLRGAGIAQSHRLYQLYDDEGNPKPD